MGSGRSAAGRYRFREPGWLGRWLELHRTSGCHLPLQLHPVALEPGNPGLLLKVLNPGASRCRWRPGNGWTVGRDGERSDDIVLKPGELVELHLVQSS